MFTFNRKKFFDAYRLRFGSLTQDLVDALEFLLGKFEADTRFGTTDVDRRQIAYCLATFKHETAHTMAPIDEIGSDAYFNKRYGPQTKVGKRLGNTKEGDGALFHGRGYVQLTGRSNYTRLAGLIGQPLVTSPALVKDPAVAYEIAIRGMTDGLFTGKKLSQYINNNKTDFEEARRIINGKDKAEDIADLARRFSEILHSST